MTAQQRSHDARRSWIPVPKGPNPAVDLVSREPDRDATGPGVGLFRKRADAPPRLDR